MQEKRWNADDEHAEFMRLFLRVLPGCAPLSPQAGKILTEEDMDVVLNPKQDGLREQTRTETSFYNFLTEHRLSTACSNSLMQMLRHDFFEPRDLHYQRKSACMRRRAIQKSPWDVRLVWQGIMIVCINNVSPILATRVPRTSTLGDHIRATCKYLPVPLNSVLIAPSWQVYICKTLMYCFIY